VRAGTDAVGETVVEVGGLSRSDAAGGFQEEFSGLVGEIRGRRVGGPEMRQGDHDPPEGE
jgi:hypothetical protein